MPATGLEDRIGTWWNGEHSGIFRILVRLGDARCQRGGVWHPSAKNNNFLPQNYKSVYTLMQFLTGRKHGPSLKPWDTDFAVPSRNKAYKNRAKIIQKINGQPKGGGRSHHCLHEYAIG